MSTCAVSLPLVPTLPRGNAYRPAQAAPHLRGTERAVKDRKTTGGAVPPSQLASAGHAKTGHSVEYRRLFAAHLRESARGRTERAVRMKGRCRGVPCVGGRAHVHMRRLSSLLSGLARRRRAAPPATHGRLFEAHICRCCLSRGRSVNGTCFVRIASSTSKKRKQACALHMLPYVGKYGPRKPLTRHCKRRFARRRRGSNLLHNNHLDCIVGLTPSSQ